MKTPHTPGPILFEGWFAPREPGLLPSIKANWDGRMIQIFTQDLEQGEKDMRLLQAAPELLEACKAICAAVADCLPISGNSDKLDVLYYKAKLLAIDQAASVCSQAILKAEGNL